MRVRVTVTVRMTTLYPAIRIGTEDAHRLVEHKECGKAEKDRATIDQSSLRLTGAVWCCQRGVSVGPSCYLHREGEYQLTQ